MIKIDMFSYQNIEEHRMITSLASHSLNFIVQSLGCFSKVKVQLNSFISDCVMQRRNDLLMIILRILSW